MFQLILGLALYLPRTVVKHYPQPDPKCLYQWISNPTQVENTCDTPLVIDVAYKNGTGAHAVLSKGNTLDLRLDKKIPLKVFVCTEGQGKPSAALDHYVHPSYKSNGYSCLDEELVFPTYHNERGDFTAGR